MVNRTPTCVVDDLSDGGAHATIAGCAGDACAEVVLERYGRMLSRLIRLVGFPDRPIYYHLVCPLVTRPVLERDLIWRFAKAVWAHHHGGRKCKRFMRAIQIFNTQLGL